MARGTRGPANDPLSSLQQQIDQLSQRVRELETKRVLAAPVSNLDKIRSGVEGEHFIDHRDSFAMWMANGNWRYGLPMFTSALLGADIPYESDVFLRDWQALEVEDRSVYGERNSENYYQDEDFPTRIYVKTPGVYMIFYRLGMGVAEVPIPGHAHAILDVRGVAIEPDGVGDTGEGGWFRSSNSKISAGDPTLDTSIAEGLNPGLIYIGVLSFGYSNEAALDLEEDPEDAEAEFPEYTRYFEPLVMNWGPETFAHTGGSICIIRLGSPEISDV